MYEHVFLKHLTPHFKDKRLEEGQAQDYHVVHLNVISGTAVTLFDAAHTLITQLTVANYPTFPSCITSYMIQEYKNKTVTIIIHKCIN
jgi:hypothetical protein